MDQISFIKLETLKLLNGKVEKILRYKTEARIFQAELIDKAKMTVKIVKFKIFYTTEKSVE